MVKFKDFFNYGYKEYGAHKGNRMCQKVIRTAARKKAYFINIYEWDHREFGIDRVSLEAEVQFYQSDDVWFTFKLHDCEHKTVEDIEAFLATVYVRLGCVPDIHNND